MANLDDVLTFVKVAQFESLEESAVAQGMKESVSHGA
jgi:hypothetical protein